MKAVYTTDSNIMLQLSDGVLYKVHHKNLGIHSEGFATANAISTSTDDNSGVICSPSTTLRLAVDKLQQYKLLLLESYFKGCARMPVIHESHKKQLGETCRSE